jgi:ribonucleoside-diphosphate reductase alpha chain
MRVLEAEALVASQALARERGPFPMQPVSRYKDDLPRRNSNLTTIAPTGSISILGNCSSGIEPVFALTMFHSVKQPDGSWRVLKVANAAFAHVAKREGFWSTDLEQHVVETGSVQGRDDVPADWQHVFLNAQEIHPHDHIHMQGAFQEHNSNSISKTINMPHTATREEIAEAYLMAYSEGCLGTTIYREGCKQVQVLTTGAGAKDYTVGQGAATPLLAETIPADDRLCPECGEAMVDEGGCTVCPACAYSHCNWSPSVE